jgi:hypothetical protein
MTPNLTQLFEGKEIRIIEQDNDFWFQAFTLYVHPCKRVLMDGVI